MVNGYGKSGVSWPVQECSSDPIRKFFEPGSKLSWHWNWNKNWKGLLPETDPGLQINAEFVLMIFAPDYLDNGVRIQENCSLIMGYNEPDHHDTSVAVRQGAKDAARGWIELAKLRRSNGYKLASPAVAFDIDWLKEFFLLIPQDTKPDYLTIHVYTTTFEDFSNKVNTYHELFGLPIIVSEFAMHSFTPGVSNPDSIQQVHDFMGQTTKWLDETEYIFKYSWFGAVRNGENLHGVSHLNRLMDEKGDLTPLGWQYVNGGHE